MNKTLAQVGTTADRAIDDLVRQRRTERNRLAWTIVVIAVFASGGEPAREVVAEATDLLGVFTQVSVRATSWAMLVALIIAGIFFLRRYLTARRGARQLAENPQADLDPATHKLLAKISSATCRRRHGEKTAAADRVERRARRRSGRTAAAPHITTDSPDGPVS